jgi:hypothetical protein
LYCAGIMLIIVTRSFCPLNMIRDRVNRFYSFLVNAMH